MIDEKRIKRFIEGAKKAFKEVDDPTFTFPINILSAYELATSIEELLKAQEPIKPKVNIDTWVCGNCGTRVEHQSMIGPNAVLAETFKFCPECGKAVKWA